MKKITSKIPVVGMEKKGATIFLNFDIDDHFRNKKILLPEEEDNLGQI